jgi:cell division protein FtsL
MKTSFAPQTRTNPIQIAKALKYIAFAFITGSLGLSYVYLKNQQFALAEEIRITEKRIKQVRAENEVLLAKTTELSSRRALQQRMTSGSLSVVQISGDKIARLTPASAAMEDGVLRTASNERAAR